MQKILIYACVLCLWPSYAWTGVVVSGNTIMDQSMNENLCALTFDDGPSGNTASLLDMLKEYDISATFFLLGLNAQNNPEIVARIKEEGHEIGNHTWTHPNLRLLSADKQAAEIIRTDNLLRSYGITPLYMRPPYGSFDERTVAIAEKMGISVILWSLDSNDWKHLPEDYAKLRSTRGTIYEDGALRGIFLFHDTHKTTVNDLPRIINNLKAGGCEKFVTVSDYLKGILDPEPGFVLNRHRQKIKPAAPVEEIRQPMYAAGSGKVPLARCSAPWTENPQVNAENAKTNVHKARGQKEVQRLNDLKEPKETQGLDLEEAHALASPMKTGS